jgi:hypothetical protein
MYSKCCFADSISVKFSNVLSSRNTAVGDKIHYKQYVAETSVSHLDQQHGSPDTLFQLQCHDLLCKLQVICDRAQDSVPGTSQDCGSPMQWLGSNLGQEDLCDSLHLRPLAVCCHVLWLEPCRHEISCQAVSQGLPACHSSLASVVKPPRSLSPAALRILNTPISIAFIHVHPHTPSRKQRERVSEIGHADEESESGCSVRCQRSGAIIRLPSQALQGSGSRQEHQLSLTRHFAACLRSRFPSGQNERRLCEQVVPQRPALYR